MEDHDLLLETSPRCRSNTHRLDALEQNTQLLHKMASALEVLANEQGHLSRKMEEMDQRVRRLDSQPGRRWELLVQTLITGLVGALAGALAGGFLPH